MILVWDFFFFWDSGDPKKDLYIVYSSGPEKDGLEAMAVVLLWLLFGDGWVEAAGLFAADVLAVRLWWLEERQPVLVCQSVSSWSQIEDFQRSLKVLDMLCWLSSSVAEANDKWLKCFVGINVKVSGLEGPAFWVSTTRKEVSCPQDCCCCPLVVTWLCWVDWMTWLAGIRVSGNVKIYTLAAGAHCCGCWNVCGTKLKLYLSFVKVSVAVVAGTDDSVLLPCFGCC